MNVAIMMWTLAAGGVALPGPQPPIAQPNSPIYQPPMAGGSAGSSVRTPFSYPSPGGQSPWTGRGGSLSPQVGFPPSLIPLAPTDPSASWETFPWGPPTAYAGPQEGGLGLPPTPGTMPYGRPRLTRPGFGGFSSSSQRPKSRTSDAFERAANRAPQASAAKPYSDYRPASPISPYMELFRTNRTEGVDNYNQYVKPRLEQRKGRRQVSRDIRGLKNSNRRQRAAIQNLGRQTQALQGNSVPGYFQNHGNYYPGLAR